MSDELDEVIAAVRERVRPNAAERQALEEVVETLIARAEAAVADLPVPADVIRVGSTGRDTWLRGDRDVDLFVRFDPEIDREDMERYGIEVGRAVLPDGRLEYAEHPYVSGAFEGYSVDLVPCVRVDSGAEIRTAVDRTPFHAAFVTAELDSKLADEVRVLKRFCEAVGIYGSDLRTRGFSGYLTELLVMTYDGFRGVVDAAAEWHPPVRLDPASHGTATFEDPLVVIDPTDPARNVAAVVTRTNLARFQHHARALLEDPDTARFEPAPPASLDPDTLRGEIDRRGTTPVAVRFPAPDVVDDQLYPQLRSSREGLVRALFDRGFDVLRADAFADVSAVIYLELEVDERPAVERHEGPPVHVREHADAFLEKWTHRADYGPFIAGERYVVEREREHSTAAGFLRSEELLEAGLGVDVRRVMSDGYDVLVGEDVTALLPEFGEPLAAFYDPSP